MKKLSIILYVAMVALFMTLLTREAMFYAELQTKRFNEATRIVKRECMKQMYEAEKNHDIKKLLYYRYYFQNPGKIVMQLGSDTVIQNFTKKNSY